MEHIYMNELYKLDTFALLSCRFFPKVSRLRLKYATMGDCLSHKQKGRFTFTFGLTDCGTTVSVC